MMVTPIQFLLNYFLFLGLGKYGYTYIYFIITLR